mmetsp:Transcript_10475/g.21122  ORF Transcript_10475/g.21122 Transcript_10475/m.21122 type:complete len:222 (+) Transcript_10475:4588-5253(+)
MAFLSRRRCSSTCRARSSCRRSSVLPNSHVPAACRIPPPPVPSAAAAAASPPSFVFCRRFVDDADAIRSVLRCAWTSSFRAPSTSYESSPSPAAEAARAPPFDLLPLLLLALRVVPLRVLAAAAAADPASAAALPVLAPAARVECALIRRLIRSSTSVMDDSDTDSSSSAAGVSGRPLLLLPVRVEGLMGVVACGGGWGDAGSGPPSWFRSVILRVSDQIR